MVNPMQTHGATASFRKLTPQMIASQQLAMANDVVKTTKSEVALALKKAAPALGIEGTTYHILDILIGLTAAGDWEQERKPLVAISNEKLAEYVCRSTRTVIRSLKKLVEAGVLAYKDSPTGRRYIHRSEFRNGKLGEIERGYGLDFSPARQRVHELKEMGEAFAARLKIEKEAKRAITRFVRALDDMSVLASQHGIDFTCIKKVTQEALDAPSEVQQKAEVLSCLYEEATHLLASHMDIECSINNQMSCAGDISDSPYNHTNPQDSKNSSKKRRAPIGAPLNINGPDYIGSELAPDKEPNCKVQANSELHTMDQISIGLISSATTHTQETLGSPLTSWQDLLMITENLRLMIGLSLSGWTQAESKTSRYVAAAILITTIEKTLREPEIISSPAGYFRACIDLAVEGRLALHRSLFGLAGREE